MLGQGLNRPRLLRYKYFPIQYLLITLPNGLVGKILTGPSNKPRGEESKRQNIGWLFCSHPEEVFVTGMIHEFPHFLQENARTVGIRSNIVQKFPSMSIPIQDTSHPSSA
jgi:hypothetical protein